MFSPAIEDAVRACVLCLSLQTAQTPTMMSLTSLRTAFALYKTIFASRVNSQLSLNSIAQVKNAEYEGNLSGVISLVVIIQLAGLHGSR